MTPKFILNVFLFMGLSVQAQWMEKFDYSDWNTQLNWQGDVKSFTIDNERLRSNNDSANVEFYISRSLQLYSEMVWEFWINLKFNTSSANYVDVYLFSDSMNLKGQKNGYFVRIGNTKDEIALYKSKAGSAPSILIDGRDNITAGSNNILKVKVERNVLGQWNLYSDLDAMGNYFHEGFVVDSSFTDAKYFGLLVKQSTASFFKKHYIDNIYAGAPIRDTLSPHLVQFAVVTDTALLFQFTEAVKPIVDSVPCFKIVGVPVLVESFRKDSVFIQLGKKLTNFVNYQFTINNLQDLNGNSFTDTSISFLFFNPETPQLKQILITEIMADPDPSVNLPNAEYVELLNRHTFPIQLKGSTLSDPTKTVVFPEFIINPGEYIVICDNNHVSSFSAYGRVLGVTGLPSLNNASDEILIRNKFGDLVHKVNYSDKWYKDDQKKNGGWSLEMIDTSGLCFEEGNWCASINIDGGTPCKTNSVNGNNKDTIAPELISIIASKEGTITLLYTETIDSVLALERTNYTPHGFEISSITYSNATVVLGAKSPFTMGNEYGFKIRNLQDCSGNVVKQNFYTFIIPDTILPSDIVINEVLFNPKGDGVDFIELFNRSNKYLDLKELTLCNKDTGSAFKNCRTISVLPQILAPKTYVLLTTSKVKVMEQFPYHDASVFLPLSSLPTMNNDKGDVWLITKDKSIIDGMLYDERMHHALLKDVDGVSLERIRSGISGLNRHNWTSASSSFYYGTPGLKNSQLVEDNENLNGDVVLNSHIISPDGDGYQDVLLVHLGARYAGLNSNVAIMDIAGRKVKDLAQNAYLGTDDFFQWDGTDTKSRKLPLGVYLLFVEIWGTTQETIQYKIPLTVGGILNTR